MKLLSKGKIIALSLIMSSVVISFGITLLTLWVRDHPRQGVVAHKCMIPEKYAAIVHSLNAPLGIPEKLLYLWVDEESRGWVAGTGAHGEKGLTQVVPTNFDSFERMYYTGKLPFDPARDDCSLEIGIKHLADCYKDTKDWFLALCEYNAGRASIRGGYIPPSTISYACRIWSNFIKD